MKYDVHVWYSTCIQVDADDKDEAEQLACDTLNETDDGTFRTIIDVSAVDVEEVEE